MKKCSKCGEEKDDIFFGKDSRLKDGLRGECKECHKKTCNAWRKRNPERVKQSSQKHYEINKDYYLKKAREQWDSLSQDKKEERALYHKEYYSKRREKYVQENRVRRMHRTEEQKQRDAQVQKEYYENNKERLKQRAHEYYTNRTPEQKSKGSENAKEWRKNNREKAKAWSAVGNAILLGDLEKPIYCELCGVFDVKIHAHHEDYSLPLDVIWLCHDCHMKIHSTNH